MVYTISTCVCCPRKEKNSRNVCFSNHAIYYSIALFVFLIGLLVLRTSRISSVPPVPPSHQPPKQEQDTTLTIGTLLPPHPFGFLARSLHMRPEFRRFLQCLHLTKNHNQNKTPRCTLVSGLGDGVPTDSTFLEQNQAGNALFQTDDGVSQPHRGTIQTGKHTGMVSMVFGMVRHRLLKEPTYRVLPPANDSLKEPNRESHSSTYP